MEDFITWLEAELKKRDWQPAVLAKKARLNTGSISRILTGTRRPGSDICLAIARTLKVPPEMVFRQAGLLPRKPEIDSETEELVFLFQKLGDVERKRLLQAARVWVEQE